MEYSIDYFLVYSAELIPNRTSIADAGTSRDGADGNNVNTHSCMTSSNNFFVSKVTVQ